MKRGGRRICVHVCGGARLAFSIYKKCAAVAADDDFSLPFYSFILWLDREKKKSWFRDLRLEYLSSDTI